MTIPFAPLKAQKGMKPIASERKIDIIVYEKQTHYRARGGEWAQQVADRIFICSRPFFQAQISRAQSLKTYLWRDITRFSINGQSISVFSNIF